LVIYAIAVFHLLLVAIEDAAFAADISLFFTPT